LAESKKNFGMCKLSRPRPLPRRTNRFLDRKFICLMTKWQKRKFQTFNSLLIPAAVKTRPIQSLFQWIESPKNYSEESEWDPTKIVIIVKIHDLWDNNKCFTYSSYLLWCVVRQFDHRMSLHKLCLYHFSIFHQTQSIPLSVYTRGLSKVH